MAEILTMPGAVDIHVHLREPSPENTSETIESGTRAALLGGSVAVMDMPNNPGLPVWSTERLLKKIVIAGRTAWVPMGFYLGSQPESDNIGELEQMAQYAIGSKFYAGETTGNDREYDADDFQESAQELHRVAPHKPIMLHAGENNLESFIEMVPKKLGKHLHVCHVNNPKDVHLINKVKDEGHPITCGVCPHHLLKTSHDHMTQGAFAEMKPPLARQDDAEELMHMLRTGEIDIIESDYAPHSENAKYEAEHTGGHCYGVPGIEHIMPLLLYQVMRENLSYERLIDATNTRPAEIMGIKTGKNTLVEWDMSHGVYRIEQEHVKSRCGWTPYLGMLAVGRVESVVIGGRTLVEGGRLRQHYSTIIKDRGIEI